jgi:hypothetical protein
MQQSRLLRAQYCPSHHQGLYQRRPAGAATQLGSAAHADTATPPPSLPPFPASLTQPGTITGEGFAAHLANNQFSALASPSPICDPNTTSTSLPAATLNTDFTYAFTESQGIVTPTLGNHRNSTVIRYLDSACQVMLAPTKLPAIQIYIYPLRSRFLRHRSQQPTLALQTQAPRIIS